MRLQFETLWYSSLIVWVSQCILQMILPRVQGCWCGFLSYERKNWFQLFGFIFPSLFWPHTVWTNGFSFILFASKGREENKSHPTTKHKKINLPSTNLASSYVCIYVYVYLYVCALCGCVSFFPSSLFFLHSIWRRFVFASCICRMMSNARCLVPDVTTIV